MHLDEQELDLLARFFAKRFPHAPDRAPILARAQLTDSRAQAPQDAWREILVSAQAIDALPDLGRAVTSTDPDDSNLREVRRLLIGPPKGPNPLLLGGLAVGSIAVAAVGLLTMVAVLRADRSEAAREQLIAAAAAPARTIPAPTLVSTHGSEPLSAASETAESTPPEAPPAPNPKLVIDAPERHITADHCLRRAQAVGYWYAGTEIQAGAGDLLVVPHDVYVRSEPPKLSNDWNTRTQVACVLYEGDVIRLAASPIAVPPDVYWVQVSGADLVAAGGRAL